MNSTEINTQTCSLASKVEKVREANVMIGTGVGIAALGVGGAIASGALCPMCIFIPPILVGAGIYQRYRAKREAPA
jgi:hypothetical protein